jgi:peroxiredoxin
MKKFTLFFLVLLLVLMPVVSSVIVAEECSIEWKVNSKLITVCGKKYKMDVAPIQESSDVYIPLRVVSEWLGFDVSWVADERAVTMNNDNTQVKLWIDKIEIVINDETKQLTIPPTIKDSRTMISTNGLGLILGKKTDVDGRYISMKVDLDEICYRWVDFEYPKNENPDETIKFSDLINKPTTKAVIVQVWYTECRPCHDQLEFFGELFRKYNADGLEIIGVCTDGPGLEADREDLLTDLKVDFPIVLDENYSIQATWFDPVFPNFFLVTPGEKCITWFHERYSEEANAKLEEMVKSMCNITD